MKSNINQVGSYFNANWQRYQSAIKNNTLYHHEMFSALKSFLSENIGLRTFSFVDVGCGDGSTIVPILSGTAIKKYIGIDAAEDVLMMASDKLKYLDCEKELIAEDMVTAILALPAPVDIIFTSYAVHHLSLLNKKIFIATCKKKLKSQGFLLMIDGILKPNQTRQEWLSALENRMAKSIPEITAEDLASRMEHPHKDDFPETIETFSQFAKEQAWKDFKVILEKEIFAFMMFANS